MQPQVQPLTRNSRRLIFGGLLLAFSVSLPVFIFYATGYRYDLTAPSPTWSATGAFYILANTPESVIFINDEMVTNLRSFRDASYIQGIMPGLHRVHVQAPGTQTWVKELSISPRIVTEAEAFNLPITPQVRFIPEFITEAGVSVVFGQSSSSPGLAYIVTGTPLFFATGTATSTYRSNFEYTLLADLFATLSSTTLARQAFHSALRQSFGFSTSSQPNHESLGTTTVRKGPLTVYETGGEVYARADGSGFRSVPFYFCAPFVPALETGIDSFDKLENAVNATATLPVSVDEKSACRTEIRLDRKGKTIEAFDFYPPNPNLVILQYSDGIYVTEIDDRGWQNTQPLYQGEALTFLVYRDGIYIKEGDLIFEVLPEVEVP